jgi:hypothetical protein
MTSDTLLRRRLAKLAAHPSGAIYGTIVATALIAATAAHEDDPGRIAIGVIVTLLVFWIAHVYANVIEYGLRHAGRRANLRAIMTDELAMVEAPALSIVLLLLGAIGLLSHGLAVNLALANGVAQLLFWGIAVARRAGRPWPLALLVGAVDAAFGVLIVVLKALLH